MSARAYRLEPRTAFHFGRDGHELEGSRESFPSDSLFAALVVAALETTGDVEGFIARWQAGGCRVSTIFPYVGSLALLPLPRMRLNLGSDARRGGKALKKIRYVSPVIFSAILHGRALDRAWVDDETGGKPKVTLQSGTVWIDESEIRYLPAAMQSRAVADRAHVPIWIIDAVPRVVIDRATSASDIYRLGRTTFNDGCGLWFVAQADALGDELDALVESLGVSGIGGERSAGYGAFTAHSGGLMLPDLPDPAGAARVLTLARYVPDEAEIDAGVLGEGASYDLVTVGGWMASPFSRAQRRKVIRMVEAGSVLDGQGGRVPVGRLVDVRPEYQSARHAHPVYRSGLAYPVGVPAGELP